MMTVAIQFTSNHLQSRAETLANELQLPIAINPADYDYLLLLTPEHLSLKKTGSRAAPLVVDFLSPSFQFRYRNASLKNEGLARALGLKKNTQPTLVDATGGLGRDSFILASLGFTLTVLERSPIIHALLRDGIERARQHKLPHDTVEQAKALIPAANHPAPFLPKRPLAAQETQSDSDDPPASQRAHPLLDANARSARDAAHRLTLIQADALTWLTRLTAEAKPDLVYLDPMFEERKKSALPKKEMLIFHEIVGDDTDAEALLAAALACAKQRVVVKRPRLAPPFNEVSPAYCLKGSSCRFDVYLT